MACPPAMNPDQPSGSGAAEPQRKAAPDVLPRDPAEIPDTTCDSTVPASLPPPAEAPVQPRIYIVKGTSGSVEFRES
jgi:hypothetical protein